MGTPTRIRWPRRWGMPRRHHGPIPRQPGALLVTAALHDVVYNECRKENARLIVFVTPVKDALGERLYTLAIQDKAHPRTHDARWPGHHTILMQHSHLSSIDAWLNGYWSDRMDANGWRPLD